VCRDHDAGYHARRHVDFTYHWRLPDVRLVQFRPGPELGGNNFLASPESLIVGFFQFFARRLLCAKIRTDRNRCFLIFRWCNFWVSRDSREHRS
jgi:hypothetical protein